MEIKVKTRKVQHIGYSLFASLPEHWCNTLNVNKGDRLKTYINNEGDLIFRKENGTNETTTKTD